MLEKIKATANFIKERIQASPEVGIILGTGLGGLVNEIEIIDSIRTPIFQTFRCQLLMACRAADLRETGR